MVRGICMSEKMPSCMRAPPEAEKTSAGHLSSWARSKTRVHFSPTTEPMEPPMNSKTKQPSDTCLPLMRPTPEMKASFSPSALRVDFSRSLYFLESVKPSGSCGSSSLSNSSKLSGSSRWAMRARAGQGRWCSQWGQTLRFFSSSCR